VAVATPTEAEQGSVTPRLTNNEVQQMVNKASRFKLIAAVYVLLVQDDRVLLLRRFNTGYEDGNYSLIAGHLDGDEEIVSAAIRETKEEAGITIDPADLAVVGVMHRRSEDERIEFFLEARRWRGTITNTEPHKCDELAWFPVDRLPENVIPYIRHAIEHFTKGSWFQSYGWN